VEESHRLKPLLGSRDQLVRAKRAVGNQVRGVLRAVRHPSTVAAGDEEVSMAAQEAMRDDAILNASVIAWMKTLAAIEAQIARVRSVRANGPDQPFL
jgi:hypothetical protein